MRQRFKQVLKKLYYLVPTIINFNSFALQNIEIEPPFYIYGRVHVRNKGRIKIGPGLRLNASYRANPVGLNTRCGLFTTQNGEICIGRNVGISGSLIFAFTTIIIDDNVLVGGGCQILDSDFHSIDFESRVLNQDNNIKAAPIRIKSGAFIGACSIILKGITIGENSVLAAGSVLTKDIPPNQIWGGNPAKFIRVL